MVGTNEVELPPRSNTSSARTAEDLDEGDLRFPRTCFRKWGPDAGAAFESALLMVRLLVRRRLLSCLVEVPKGQRWLPIELIGLPERSKNPPVMLVELSTELALGQSVQCAGLSDTGC